MAGDAPSVVGDRYELRHVLGAGGMAEVWLASDRRLNDKPVAVKMLHGYQAGVPHNEAELERARREAFAASRLSHPNLVGVTDFIAERGAPFIVMEYVEGSTLADLCAHGGLPVAQAAHLVGQVASALSEAHAAQIIHRDIKPANIIVTPRGDAKLADFGIARAPDDPRYTKTGMFTGTMRYLAPELLDGASASPASDVWSLGATLFEAVEGQPAFDAPTNVGLIAAIAVGPIPRVHAPELGALVARMLARDAAVRPSAAEAAQQLRALSMQLTHQPSAGHVPPAAVGPSDATVYATGLPQRRPPAGRPRTRPKKRSRAWMVVAVPAVLVAVGAGLAIGLNQGDGNHPLAENDNPTGRTSVAAVPTHDSPLPSQSPPGAGNPAPSSIPRVGGGAPSVAQFHGVTVVDATNLDDAPAVTAHGTKDPSRVESLDLVKGKGAAANPDATVMVRYVGVLYLKNKIFQSSWLHDSKDTPFQLDSTIAGFRTAVGGGDGIAPMRVGGRRLVIVPAKLAYGSAGTTDVPPNSPLVFVVDLRSVSG